MLQLLEVEMRETSTAIQREFNKIRYNQREKENSALLRMRLRAVQM